MAALAELSQISQHRTPEPATVLNSWKEIAEYLGRSVRTVQRWESELLLPVHRPRGSKRSAVMAIPGELDAWVKQTPATGLKQHSMRRSHFIADQQRQWAELIAYSKELQRALALSRRELRAAVSMICQTVSKSGASRERLRQQFYFDPAVRESCIS